MQHHLTHIDYEHWRQGARDSGQGRTGTGHPSEYFYPKDNTSGCTAEACSLRDHYGELQGAGYEVVGVSKDSAASHVKFKEKHELPFPLIADVDKTLLQAMGAWGEKVMYGKKTEGTIRTTFIINEEGIIEQIFAGKQVKTKEHAEQILQR